MEGPEKGHLVYFIACNNFVKVGYAADVYRRLSQLQTGNPVELKLVMTFGYPDEITARKEERYWREQLVACGKAAHGEWVELEYNLIGWEAQGLVPLRFLTLAEILDCEYDPAAMLEEQLSARHCLRARLTSSR